MTDIEKIRKKHEEWKKRLVEEVGNPCPTYFGNSLTISDVDALFRELDEARGKDWLKSYREEVEKGNQYLADIARLTEENEGLNKELTETRTWLSELREEQESQESLDHFAKTLCDILHITKLKTDLAACRMELDEARVRVKELEKCKDEATKRVIEHATKERNAEAALDELREALTIATTDINRGGKTILDFYNCWMGARDAEITRLKTELDEATKGRCDTCGAKVSSYPNGCPTCGAPECCQWCCKRDALQEALNEARGKVPRALMKNYYLEHIAEIEQGLKGGRENGK